MTETCELCGRGCLIGGVVPSWYPYEHICTRKKCDEAIRDAILAIVDDRERHSELIQAIRERHNANGAPVGYRQDTLSQMYIENSDWWGLEIIQHTEKP